MFSFNTMFSVGSVWFLQLIVVPLKSQVACVIQSLDFYTYVSFIFSICNHFNYLHD